jgi:hypothetical protein
VVTPFALIGGTGPTCTVTAGTRIFVTAVTYECSRVENAPPCGGGKSQLRTEARASVAVYDVPTVTVDGKSVRVREVETPLLAVHLPKDNVFGSSERRVFSVGDGWVGLLNPMRHGTHHIVIQLTRHDPSGEVVPSSTTTTIYVSKHHQTARRHRG